MKKIYSLLAIIVLLISSMPAKGQGVVSKEIEAGTDLKVNAKKVITAQNLTYQGNQSISKDNFVAAESAYRKAIGTNPADATPAFNLGSSFYNNQSYKEALSPLKKAASAAQTQEEKHAVFHNIGNVFMKNKEYEKAVAAYKESLRNNPIDNQTRYNLAIAKEMLKKDQQDKDKDKEKQEKKEPEDSKDQEKKDNKDKEGDQKKDKEGNPDKGDGDQKDKDGEPKDPSEKEEQKKGEGDQKKETPQKPKEDLSQAPPERKSQLSPQQVENLLEAMQNAEKKSQEKLEAKKVKGVPVKTKKDW